MSHPTKTIEDYLEYIFTMENEGQPVIGARLAERLAVSAPTVTDTLKRMKDQGFIEMDRRKVVTLTERGREVATAMVRRHALLERWLTDTLGLDWATAHTEAHRLEHAVSDLVEERLSALLGHPTTCPHGNPIPGPGVITSYAGTRALSEIPEGEQVRLRRIVESTETQPDLMSYLERQGLKPGVLITVREVVPGHGPLLLDVEGRSVPLGPEAAAGLRVETVSVAGVAAEAAR